MGKEVSVGGYPLSEKVMGLISGEFGDVEGRLKTFIEALTEDPAQCKARKDMAEQLIWKGYGFLRQRIEIQIKSEIGETKTIE